jgi:hypothetical protein
LPIADWQLDSVPVATYGGDLVATGPQLTATFKLAIGNRQSAI